MPEVSAKEWDEFLKEYQDAHILQSARWGELKASFGWQATRIQAGGMGAQLLFRRLPLGFSLAYIPRGPVGAPNSAAGVSSGVGASSATWTELLNQVDAACRKRRSVFLKIEPDTWENAGECPPPAGFRSGLQSIQPPRTILIDLGGPDEEVLGRMKQKTRYNIRLAMKKGVVIRPSADLDLFHRMMEATGQRDQFGVHSLEYYRKAYELFHPYGECELLLAELEGEPLSMLMVFARGRRAWYFYGASSSIHREAMSTYLLQWEAMRWARSMGCSEYDLWGVPDAEESVLEKEFTQRSDGLWGVYRFKRGFGGVLRRSAGPWDRVYQPALFRLYQLWLRRGSKVEG
jgi:lipid II:glycine glycyltransferase (peptidoglycan interpeptide bridge formation enzyme)